MSDITSTIAIGATGSVVGAIFLSILAAVFKTRIAPIIRGVIIKVPDISGDWEYNEKGRDGRDIKGRMTIKQFGTKIKAVAVRDHHVRREFRYSGTFEAGQLILNFEENGNEGYIVGAMVLKLSSSTTVLEGKTVYFHHKTNQVVANPKLFKKC